MKRLFTLVLILTMGALMLVAPLPSVQAQGAQCTQSVSISVASGTSAVLVPGAGASSTFVCGFVVSADTIATTVQFKSGTGTTCGTGTVNLGGAMRLCDECNIAFQREIPIWQVSNPLTGAATPDFCITTATGAVTGFLVFGRS